MPGQKSKLVIANNQPAEFSFISIIPTFTLPVKPRNPNYPKKTRDWSNCGESGLVASQDRRRWGPRRGTSRRRLCGLVDDRAIVSPERTRGLPVRAALGRQDSPPTLAVHKSDAEAILGRSGLGPHHQGCPKRERTRPVLRASALGILGGEDTRPAAG